MGSPINFTSLVAGNTVTAAGLNANFALINTFLNAGIANSKIANSKHNLVWTWHMDEIATGTEHIGVNIPATLTDGGTFAELSVFASEVGAAGVIKARLHNNDVYPPTSLTGVSTQITSDADGEFTETTSFTPNGAFAENSRFYIQYIVSGNAVQGVTISLYATADNRS